MLTMPINIEFSPWDFTGLVSINLSADSPVFNPALGSVPLIKKNLYNLTGIEDHFKSISFLEKLK